MLSELMAVLLAAPLLAAGGGERVDARRPAAADAVVTIDGAGGALRIVGWDKGEVWVTGTLGAGAEGLELSGPRDRVDVEVDTLGHPDSVKSDLEIHVPAGARVQVSVMSADITFTGVSGTVDADTVAGDISVTGSAREVTLESVNGSVTAACACARAHVESVNGAVTVTGGHGEIEASTVNGALTVTGGKFERTRLETVNGRITFDGELLPRATLSAESVGGSIELRLPAGADAHFKANTFSGSIRNEWGEEGRRTSKYTREQELSFTAGSGGASVDVQTLSGDVILTKR
jgi:DUF4097 and DUF4098 domain-containing protein YvlB